MPGKSAVKSEMRKVGAPIFGHVPFLILREVITYMMLDWRNVVAIEGAGEPGTVFV
jgi:hypothetical protein